MRYICHFYRELEVVVAPEECVSRSMLCVGASFVCQSYCGMKMLINTAVSLLAALSSIK